MGRDLRRLAVAVVLAAPVLVAFGLPAAATPPGPPGPSAASTLALARAHMAALESRPWGHRPGPGAPSSSGVVRAASRSRCISDPLGDEVDINGQPANQPRADLVSTCATYSGTTIALSAATAVLSNPFTDPAWQSSSSGVQIGPSTGPTWTLWSTGDPSALPIAFVQLANFGGSLEALVVPLQGSGPSSIPLGPGTGCTGAAHFVATGPNAGYSVSFPAGCLGEYGRFYWDVSMTYDPANDTDGSLGVGDFAPNSGALPEVDVFPAAQGYWLMARDGGVFTHGSAPFRGSEGGLRLTSPIVAAAGTPDGRGYFLVGADGGVFTHGDAQFHGSTGSRRLTSPIVNIAVTPDGGGYILVGAGGSVFSFGDAPVLGSESGFALSAPIVAAGITPDDGGYWLFAADGGVFAFGDAGFFGSLGGLHLNRPIVGAALDPETGGYWLVGSDGGVFSFHAPFFGSTGAIRLNAPVVGITSAQGGSGYRLVAGDGGLFDFGRAAFAGSEGARHLNAPMVAAASVET